MKRLLSLVSLFLILAQPVEALTGVGALADQLASGTDVRLFGKTAPWAEVVVIDTSVAEGENPIVAVAEIEPDGEFDFVFKLGTKLISQLQIFAIDDLGDSSRVSVASIVGEVLLPPTIVNDVSDPPSTTRVALTGMSYPGAQITLTLIRDEEETFTFQMNTDEDGYWKFLNEDLPAGKYVGVARSRVDNLESELSQEIFFEILGVTIPPGVIEIVDRIIDLVPGAELRRLIREEPELVSRVLAPLAALPFIGFLLQDLIAILLKLIYGLLHLLGWRKERRRWGVVYDSISKKPINRAIVRLYQVMEDKLEVLVETDVTDADGGFAFLPKAGKYVVKVTRGSYIFPSKIVKARGRDGEYLNLYHGEVLEVAEGSELDISIPMDPVEAHIGWQFYVRKYLGPAWRVFGWMMLIAGLILSTRSLLVSINTLNIVVFLFYVGLIIWNLFNGFRVIRRTSVVLESGTNKPVEGVNVAVYEVEFNRLIQRRISDEKGRFLLILQPGKYKLEVLSVDWVWDKANKDGYKGEVIDIRGTEKAKRVKIFVGRK